MADDEMSPPSPAPTDPRLPLSAMQVFKLKKSWKGIKRCLEDTGVEMFIRYFKTKSPSKVLFEHFKSQSLDELRMDESLEKLAGKVMAVFDECMLNIENVDGTVEVMDRTALLHKGMNGFAATMFLDFQEPFLDAVKITLGDRYSDNMDTIYKITIRYLLDTLVKSHKALS
ncbi:uncharacterized protein [Littorina saxatilis]|uniref:Globin n=1 Tax=Littorina saxatilis TaxID=31220 RepID=A0AAN9BHZ1_9CAEN